MKVVFAARGLPVCDYRVGAAARLGARPRRRSPPRSSARWASRCSSSRPTSDRASASRKPRTPPRSRRRWSSPASFDRKIVVEAAVPDAREIECAVLGNDEPEASVPGEIIPSREFYDYEAKYLDDGSRTVIPGATCPARSPPKSSGCRSRRSRRSTAPAWRASTSCSRATTARSTSTRSTPSPASRRSACTRSCGRQRASSYPALLDRLIALALERHAEKQQLRTSVT